MGSPRGLARGKVLAAGAVVLVVLGGLLALRPWEEPDPAATDAGVTCAPTPGEAAQGTTREVAADAPSTARLGPGGDVERTANTVAAGRGGTRAGGDRCAAAAARGARRAGARSTGRGFWSRPTWS